MITFPPKFKTTQLKEIARLCGKSRSGTKALIAGRITDDLKDFKPLAPGTRVLSIDLGIRNLAYSLLEVPGSSQDTKGRRGRPRKNPTTPVSIPPILHAWERLALIPKTPQPPKPKSKTKRPTKKAARDEDPGPGPDITAGAAEAEQDRNLAYNLLEVPGNGHETKKRRGPARKNPPAPVSIPPILHARERSALIPENLNPPKPESKTKKLTKKDPDPDPDTTTASGAAEAAEQDPATTAVPIEDFSPLRLSQLAAKLVLTRLLPLRPDVITLEQQRFRSMGGSGVFEWTLRVNSLESMLYAAFATLKQLDRWPGGRMEGVVARNVLEFMAVAQGGEEAAKIWSKTGHHDNKNIKKAIVGRMLQSGRGVRIDEDGQLGAVVKEYLEKWNARGKRGKAGSEGLKKLDDLADCLLQGIAFVSWQENKKRLLEGGVEALEGQMVTE